MSARVTRSVALALVVIATGTVALAAPDLAVRAGRLHPVSGPPIDDAVVLVENGTISAVGPAATVPIPAGVAVVEAAVVTPGFVDAHSVVGLAGVYNSDRGQVQDQDQLETSDPLQPELRAVDAYDPLEPLVAWVRSFGVTTIHTGHGPGAVISGQTLVATTSGDRVEDVVFVPAAAVAGTLGASVSRNFDSPGTRAKTAALLREALVGAAAYRDALQGDSPPDRDLRKETLVRVLDGELALMLTANTAAEIATALRLADEFDVRLWLDGAAEAYRMIEPIRAAGVPVLLHPTMQRAGGDTRNLAFDTAKVLAEAGVPFAFQSGFENYVPKARVLLYEAQVAVNHGLDDGAALRAMTLEPARVLGLDDHVGSIEVGKQADLVLFDGDPFEYTTHVCRVLIAGETVSDECH